MAGRRFSTVGQGNERKACALIQRRSDGQLHQATIGDGFTRGADEAEEPASPPCTACSKLLISLQRRVTATWGQLRAHSG